MVCKLSKRLSYANWEIIGKLTVTVRNSRHHCRKTSKKKWQNVVQKAHSHNFFGGGGGISVNFQISLGKIGSLSEDFRKLFFDKTHKSMCCKISVKNLFEFLEHFGLFSVSFIW